MLEMVGLVLMLTVLIYAVSKGMIGDLARPYVSMVWPARPPEITSSPAPEPAAIASPPRTDAGTDGRTPPIAPELRPASLDTVRELRAHGFTRDEARALLRGLGYSLGNNTWADAAPAPTEGQTVTPIAGRATKAKFEYDDPALNYVEPSA